MWKRKELKTEAKKVVSKNYWTVIVICFIVALFTGEFGTSIIGLGQTEGSMDPNYILNKERFLAKEESEQDNTVENKKILNIIDEKTLKEALNEAQTRLLNAFEMNLNSATKSQKYIFRIWDAVNLFNVDETKLGVKACIVSLIALIFTIFIADPLIVAGKKYFIEASNGKNPKINIILDIFKKENIFNVAIIMFLRNIYNLLWYLTIIGGVIKTYEYRMIPYILADNPKIKRKEAFKLSKQMMKGNKWKTFILDMSFFGWNFLSVLTFGLLSILYVNPYNAATIAELYKALKKEQEKNIEKELATA